MQSNMQQNPQGYRRIRVKIPLKKTKKKQIKQKNPEAVGFKQE